MKPYRSDEHHCVFQVRCDHAQQVKLILEYRRGGSQIFSLKPRGNGLWETTLNLAPGEYRYCYHAYNGRSLTYLTPPDAPMDGLKALLHVGAEIDEAQHAEFIVQRYGVSLRPQPFEWTPRLLDEDDHLPVGNASPVS